MRCRQQCHERNRCRGTHPGAVMCIISRLLTTRVPAAGPKPAARSRQNTIVKLKDQRIATRDQLRAQGVLSIKCNAAIVKSSQPASHTCCREFAAVQVKSNVLRQQCKLCAAAIGSKRSSAGRPTHVLCGAQSAIGPDALPRLQPVAQQ